MTVSSCAVAATAMMRSNAASNSLTSALFSEDSAAGCRNDAETEGDASDL